MNEHDQLLEEINNTLGRNAKLRAEDKLAVIMVACLSLFQESGGDEINMRVSDGRILSLKLEFPVTSH
ncbi:hypothetical protein [Rahnella inusitata]|uniref:hypothetical protein n=1 Tax=Rahnella inusitata TaxID=58169 RepID=UPI0039AF31E4